MSVDPVIAMMTVVVSARTSAIPSYCRRSREIRLFALDLGCRTAEPFGFVEMPSEIEMPDAP
jgi:hypothetical protein